MLNDKSSAENKDIWITAQVQMVLVMEDRAISNYKKFKHIQVHKIPTDVNVYIVGDIHGCYDLLITQLLLVGFNFDKDICFGVGDLVDRGPQNEQCISLVHEPWFYTVRGNHEDYCLQGATDYRIEVHHRRSNNGGEWLYKYPKSERVELLKPLEVLPYMIEIQYLDKIVGIVHADMPIHDWDVTKIMVKEEWNDRAMTDHLTWGRNLVYQKHCEIANAEYVFMGHTIVQNPHIVGNAIFIDTGACRTGNMTIINLREFLHDFKRV